MSFLHHTKNLTAIKTNKQKPTTKTKIEIKSNQNKNSYKQRFHKHFDNAKTSVRFSSNWESKILLSQEEKTCLINV